MIRRLVSETFDIDASANDGVRAELRTMLPREWKLVIEGDELVLRGPVLERSLDRLWAIIPFIAYATLCVVRWHEVGAGRIRGEVLSAGRTRRGFHLRVDLGGDVPPGPDDAPPDLCEGPPGGMCAVGR